MATDPSPPPLDALLATIAAAIHARFPHFATVEFHREASTQDMATPACLLAMTRCDRSKDNADGSGQMQALLRFEARVALAADAPGVALQLRNTTVDLATWLHQLGRFPGVASGAIDVIAALPEDTAMALPGLRSWIVEWSLPMALGSNAWEETGGVVPRASFSFAPEIGRAHEPRYQPLPEHAP